MIVPTTVRVRNLTEKMMFVIDTLLERDEPIELIKQGKTYVDVSVETAYSLMGEAEWFRGMVRCCPDRFDHFDSAAQAMFAARRELDTADAFGEKVAEALRVDVGSSNGVTVRISEDSENYEFVYGGKVLHTLHIASSSMERVKAHLSGFAPSSDVRREVKMERIVERKADFDALQEVKGFYAYY